MSPWIDGPGSVQDSARSVFPDCIRAVATPLLSLLLISTIPEMTVARSTFPDLTGFENAAVVSDAELAEMRGRFIVDGEVNYFGIQMFTVWQTAKGALLTTGLEWSANAGGGAQTPSLSLYHSLPDGTVTDPGAGPEPVDVPNAPPAFGDGSGPVLVVGPPPKPLPITAEAGGLETARGVVQSVQAAGDVNAIGNDMRFNVTEGQVAVSFAPPPQPLGTPMDLQETTTVEFQSDTKVTAFVEPNAIGYVVKINNVGTVLQEVRGGSGRAAQHANIRSNLNAVRNTMNINFGLAPVNRVLRENISSVIRLTSGLRQ